MPKMKESENGDYHPKSHCAVVEPPVINKFSYRIFQHFHVVLNRTRGTASFFFKFDQFHLKDFTFSKVVFSKIEKIEHFM